MPIRSTKIDAAWKKAVLAVCGIACALGGWQAAKWGLVNSAGYRASDLEVAQYLAGLAPDDPQPHYASGVFLERSFDPDDVQKALKQFETATALTPNNYLLWLELGRARERSGDAEGAEAALRRALELAPNYSRVQWALGNALLRQGRTEEAFAEIRKAVLGDSTLADAAAVTAWQFFDGNVEAIRRAMQGSPHFNAVLAGQLIREKKFDQAMQIWNDIPVAEKKSTLRERATTMLKSLLDAKQFTSAMRVAVEIGDGAGIPEVGKVTNGGFESAVKSDGAGPFDWQIAGGLQPQIVLSGGQKHGGNNSLYLIFNSSSAADFRSVSQTIVVVPGSGYEVEIFYRSDLKSVADVKWEVVDASDGKRLAVSDSVIPNSGWTPIRIGFKANSDGIILRLVREGCGPVCNANGNVWFDDVTLRNTGG